MTIARRLAVALAMALAVGFAMMWTWGGSRYALFFRTIIIGVAGTAVFSLFEGSPAYQKGVRRGDVIAQIEGKDT